MQSSRALLIDDEEPARCYLRELLAVTDPAVTIVGEAAELSTARELVARGGYDFLFLDVKLGADNGFDLVPEVPPDKPIIFVSGYQQHAHRAFEVHAHDYLVKPVEPARLTESLHRLRSRRRPPSSAGRAAAVPGAPLPESFALEVNGRPRLVQAAEIALVTAQQNYSAVHLVDGSEALVRRSLKSWIAALPASDFVRVDRHALVNLNHVLGYRQATRRHLTLRVAGVTSPVGVSRLTTTPLKARLRARFPY